MNILEMLDLDFKGFVTSPAGILIIVGIICLLVGIVMFLKEGKKAKVAKENKSDEVKTPEQPVEQTVSAAPTPVETPVVVPATNDGVTEVPVPAVTDTLNLSETTPVETPVVNEIKTESLDIPTQQKVEDVQPIQQEVLSAPVIEPVKIDTPVVETLDPVVEKTPTVYGGVSPEVSVTIAPEEPREIYGGANPLENTSPIPTNEINAAYNGANTNVAPVVVDTPVIEPVVSTPQQQPEIVAPVQPEPVKEEVEKLEF